MSKKVAKTTRPKVKAHKATVVKAKVAKTKSGNAKGIRPGSKLEIVANLLKRQQGCTAKEALSALGWPAISFPQQAEAAGLKLRKEREGRITRYWGEAG